MHAEIDNGLSKQRCCLFSLGIYYKMCWNASVSLNTYIFSLFASLFALYNKVINIYVFMFFQSFIIMQLIEYMIWSKSFSNRLLSQLAFVVILLQPLFSLLILKDTDKETYLAPLLAMYATFVLYVLLFLWSKKRFESIPGPNGHLAWLWLNDPSFDSLLTVAIWLFFFLIGFLLRKKWIEFLFLTISICVTFVLFAKDQTWGSLWCWFANLSSVALILLVFCKEFC